MKKITILSLHMKFGGIEKSIVSVANLLCEYYDVEIVNVYKLLDKESFEIDKRVKVRYLLDNIKPNHEEIRIAKNSKNTYRIFKEYMYGLKVLYYRRKSMVNFIKNCNSDYIISTRSIFNDWLSIYGKKESIKIGWEHNHYHGNKKYAYDVTRSCKNLDYLVCVSKDLTKFYSDKLNKCKCVYIPNMIEYLPEKRASLKSNHIISIGRLSPEKGFIDLLRIFNPLLKKHPNWILDIIGDGKEKDNLINYINANDLKKQIILHGFKDKKFIDKKLDKSALYVMTSYTESFGIVLIEAMSHGVPCIAFSSAEGASELINSGENGYLILHRNFESMSKKIEDLMNDLTKRKEIGNNSYEFSKQFTGEKVIKKWIELLEEGDVSE